MKIPKFFGIISYFVCYPGILVMLYGSRRAYAVIQVDNELLVLKNWLGTQKKWHLPGGGAKAGESFASAVKREVQEETGLTNIHFKEISPEIFVKSKRYSYKLFSIKLSQKPELKLSQSEIIDARWIKLQDLHKKPLSTEIEEYLKIANH